MSEFDQMKLRKLDLSVLLIFLALMRHRKAAAVAAEMGLTQSAVSHALSRLRGAFGDPLFLRRPHGLEPTAVARALEPDIRAGVEAVDRALSPRGAFEPSTAEAVVRISALDFEVATLLPGVLPRLRQEAQGIRLDVSALDRDAALAGLSEGRIDLALGYFWALPPAFLSTPLFEEDYLVAAMPGHPVLSGALSAYLDSAHVVVSPRGGLTGIVDRALARTGRRRQVVLAVPQFLPALAILPGTDLVATLPARLVRAHAAAFGLHHAPPPVAIRRFATAAVRHRRDEKSPMLDWLTAELAGAAS